MTEQGDPLARRQQYISYPITTRRKKLAPDPDVRRAIVDAASKSVREHGVRGLSVAAVLERARLSTRAFYRHFDSKDQLVAAVFLELTRAEVLRLRTKISEATNPVEAVAAWIDGRLKLAFDEDIKAELRQVSLEAQSKAFSSRDMVTPAYGAILEPLIEQPGDRGEIHPRRGVGGHPAAVGNTSLGPHRGSRAGGAVLPARAGRGATHDRTSHRWRHTRGLTASPRPAADQLGGHASAIGIEAGHNTAVNPKAATSAPAGSTFSSRA